VAVVGEETYVTKGDCMEHRRQLKEEMQALEARRQKALDDVCEVILQDKRDITSWNLRIEAKIDRLIWWLMVTEASVIVTFAFVMLGRAFDVHII
jgi:hypothetical protein